MDLTIPVKFNEDGQINFDATMALASAALEKLVLERLDSDEKISAVVSDIFDKYPNARVGMEFVINEALRRIDVTPATYNLWSSRVHKYLQDNSQGKKLEDGSYERPNSKFVIVKGKGGGMHRRPVTA